jgi:hypothetical protein
MVTEPRSLAGLFLRPRAVQPGAQAETRTVGRGSLRDDWVCPYLEPALEGLADPIEKSTSITVA